MTTNVQRLRKIVKDIHKAKMINVRNVADYFWLCDQEFWDLTEMVLAPPFPYFITEYTAPVKIYSKERGIIYPEEPFGTPEVMTVFRQLDELPSTEDHVFIDHRPVPQTIPGAYWYVLANVFLLYPEESKDFLVKIGFDRPQKDLIKNAATFIYALDEEGFLLNYNDQTTFWEITFDTRQGALNRTKMPISMFHVSGLALDLLHCRNVEIVSPPPERKRKKVRRKKKKNFEMKYHTLAVKLPDSVTYKYENDGGDDNGSPPPSNRLHTFRGSFWHYGPKFGKGALFGRNNGLSYKIWKPSKVRADEEFGMVEKDYKLTGTDNATKIKNHFNYSSADHDDHNR